MKTEIFSSRQFPDWLAQSNISLALTTYQTGQLFFLGVNSKGQLSGFQRLYDRAMGLYTTTDRLYLSSKYQIWQFDNSLNQGALYNGYDKLYIPRIGYTTGDLDIHDIIVDKNERLIFVSTILNCLATVSQSKSCKPIWKPHFISRIINEDRCHLNGLAMVDGQAKYVSACSRSDMVDGWRDRRHGGGIVMEVQSNEIVCTGLSMPHSPRWYQDKLWLHNSGKGEFGYVDLQTGKFEPVTFCPGYLRGLAFHDNYAVVGLSKPRAADKTFSGLPLDDLLSEKDADARCGLMTINLNTGAIANWVRLEGLITELYDVQVIPQVKRPMALGFQTEEIAQLISLEPLEELFTNNNAQLILKSPKNQELARLTKTEKLRKITLNNNQEIAKIIDSAQGFYQQQNYQQAELLLKDALSLSRRHQGVKDNLIKVLKTLNRNEEILSLFSPQKQQFVATINLQKILVITNLYPPQELGGYGRSIYDFANILQQRGHTIYVLTSDAPYLGKITTDEVNINRQLQLWGTYENGYQTFSESGKIRTIIKHNDQIIKQAINQIAPDVCLIGNIDFLGEIIFQPLLTQEIPIIHHLGFDSLSYPVEKTPTNPLYHLATASQYVADNIRQKGYQLQDMTVIYPGAKVDLFSMPVLPKLDRLRIIYASLLIRSKGIETLLQALTILKQNNVEFTCSIAGDTLNQSYVNKLKKFVQQNNLEQQVSFLGLLSREELIDLYSTHNVLVFPAISPESFGISQVEAMAASLTVITSGVGGASEIIKDEINGLVFPPENASVLAEKLSSLLADKNRWQSLAIAGERTAKSQFDSQISVNLLEQKFAQLLQLKKQFKTQNKSLITNSNQAKKLFDQSGVYKQQGNFTQAEKALREVIKIQPDFVKAYNNLGTLLQNQGKIQEAKQYYEKTLQLNPNLAETISNLASIWQLEEKMKKAKQGYQEALKLKPDYVPALFNLGNIYEQEKRFGGAIECFTKVINLKPDYTEAYISLGHIYEYQEKLPVALECYQKALECNADLAHLQFNIAMVKLRSCNWDNYPSKLKDLLQLLDSYQQKGEFPAFNTFALNALPVSPEIHLAAAQSQAKNIENAIAPLKKHLSFSHSRPRNKKLRIGYISPDFREHAVGRLIYDLFIHHDRSQFKIYGYLTLDVNDHITEKIKQGCDEFVNLSTFSTQDSAQKIYSDRIDIMIDLAGYTIGHGANVLALQPAPIQVQWLGYPNTMGADFMQYYLADQTLITEEIAKFYTEKIVYLPHTFVASSLPISKQKLTRTQFGLPEDAFVFCCLNSHYKINPHQFAVWMNILEAVPNSVLWLGKGIGQENLVKEAEKRRIDSQRIIFAQKIVHDQYLARYALADLYLDTFIYNAGSTATAVLWAGLPMLTCLGNNNASRMGASICRSANLEEAVCHTVTEYQEKAIKLATNPDKLLAIRQRLQDSLVSADKYPPLFQIRSFVKNLENTLLQL